MPHVFISYVRQNTDVIDRLRTDLESRGVRIWLDRNDIEPGARWRDAIKNAIRDGNFFLACFSKEYSERDRSYMNEELTLAIDELRARPSNKTWFIPILINDTAIPSRSISHVEDLSDLQVVKLYEDWSDGISRILRVIKHDDPVSSRVYYLIEVLQHPFHNERLHALQQLSAIGSDAIEAVPILVNILKDPNTELRLRAVGALQAIGPAGADAVPAIAKALKDQDEDIRCAAAYALQAIGPAAADAVPALAEALKDRNADVRRRAAYALQAIGPAAADAVPALAEALKDWNVGVCLAAADALSDIGPATASAALALAEAPHHDRDDRDGDVSWAAHIALKRIGPAAVPALAETLKDADPNVRRRAAYALQAIGPAAADAVPALAKALKDQDADVRSRAADALRGIGPAAVPPLAKALKGRDADVRSRAADALKSIRQKS